MTVIAASRTQCVIILECDGDIPLVKLYRNCNCFLFIVSSTDDALLNSMISSMTAAAFAAAKVADGSGSWFQNQGDGFSDEDDEDSDDDDENTNPNEGKSSGLISRVQHLFERLTKTAENANFDKNKPDPIVDQDSKERVVYMIDSCKFSMDVVSYWVLRNEAT